MTKKITLVLAALALTTSVYAKRTDKDTFELGGSIKFDAVSETGARFSGDIITGYFIRKDTMIGARFAFDTSQDYNNLGLFISLEQYLELKQPVMPYLGVDFGLLTCSYKQYEYDGLSYGNEDWFSNNWWGYGEESSSTPYRYGSYQYSADRHEKNNNTAMVIGLRPGFKYYFTEQAALDTSLDLTLASDKIYKYRYNTGNKNYSVGIRTGLRYAFF
ncbi:MAG: hypothetical protein FWF84_00060 [Kiritimatiellaeota bacterium]|nr:hypothetical protein [Kiritimatiellota bacterium]